jgi:hypothetical protein
MNKNLPMGFYDKRITPNDYVEYKNDETNDLYGLYLYDPIKLKEETLLNYPKTKEGEYKITQISGGTGTIGNAYDYQVWLPGEGWKSYNKSDFEKLYNENFLNQNERSLPYEGNESNLNYKDQKAYGGYMYDGGGPTKFYKKAQYDPNTGKILEYAGTQGNEYYVTPNTPQGIDFQRTLPELEKIENTGLYNPDIVGPTAPRFIPSETGWIQNPNYQPPASGRAEPTMGPIEAALFAPVAGAIASKAIPAAASALELPAVVGGKTLPWLTGTNILGVTSGITGANMLSSDLNSGYYTSDKPWEEKLVRGLETGLNIGFSPGLMQGIGKGLNTGLNSTNKFFNNKNNFGFFSPYKPSLNPTKHQSLYYDQRASLLKDLQSTEGRRRLQNLIDNNQHLKDLKLTPDDIIKDISQTPFITRHPVFTSQASEPHIEQQIRSLVKQGKISKNYLSYRRNAAFKNKHHWIKDKQGNVIEFDVDPNNGFAWRIAGPQHHGYVSIGDNRSKEDALRVFEHEILHLFQRGKPLQGIDNSMRSISTKSYPRLLLEDVFKKRNFFDQKHYFRTGSKKKEAGPFGAEIRYDLLRRGILKNRYDPITPQMLKDHYAAYKNSKNNEIDLRVYNFMKNKDKNFDLLSEAMNNMPALLPTIGVGAAGVIGGASAIQGSQPEQQSYGGPINPYMYYSGGPMYYDVGGKVWKNIAAGLYGAGEGILDTVTMGATDQLTDKGFDWLTKVGNKNIDLSDPDDVKFLKTQQQIKGYSNAAGAIGTAIFTGNVQGAIGQGTKGLNTAFQASDWASDDFKKWSQGISGVAGLAAGFAGGLNSDSFNAAAKAGTGVAGFGQKAGKIGSFGNQAIGMVGGNKQSLFQQAQAREELLKSPEYLAMQAKGTQDYVNQGLSFDNGGNINNNSLNLQNSMRDKYKNYRTRYSKGGTTLEKYGINLIPKSSGLHHENAYGGVPIGPNAMAEGGEYVLDDSYVVSDEVNGQNTQTDEFGRTMAENLKRRLDKYTLRDLSKYKGNLRRPMDPLVEETIEQIKQRAIKETELARAEAKAKEEQRQAMVNGALQYAAAGGKLNKDITKIVEEEYAAAYGGRINPKKYKGLNMPGYSKGGKLPKEILRARVESHMSPQEADAYVNQYGEGGGIHIKESKKGTFTAAATKHGKSVQEFARQVLANKENYSSAMVKKANFARNAAGWKHAHGGPVVSNVNQDFDLYAQNRGGMMMAQGGDMYAPGGPYPPFRNMFQNFLNRINQIGVRDPKRITDKVSPQNMDHDPTRRSNAISMQNPDLNHDPIENAYKNYTPNYEYGSTNEDEYLANVMGIEPVSTNSNEPVQPKQPNEGLTGLDYASMAAQVAGPLSQLYYGLKGPDDVNYERIKADKIDPYRAITLANKQSRQAQDLAGYNLRQNAPTSGSYMSNMRALGLQAANQRGAQTAGIQYEADVANTQMQNQVNAQNAQIAMQEQIDRLQEKDAARTNVTEGLSGIGSSTANMIRDYRTNQVNKTIANNIGTGNFKLVPDGQGGFKFVPNTEGGTFTPTPYNNPYNTTSTNTAPPAASSANTTTATTTTTTPTKSIEFTDNIKDQKTGDAFRAWVNKNYPIYAKNAKLDPSGKYDNNYIKEAWKLYGKEYLGQ